ncbi:MAG: class I SAM-dependent methyltransferase, partial [Anaerolineaceae bacterium]|nr:class I SAM-dependent methyltransferase [Anaerolineaceae bacterium]
MNLINSLDTAIAARAGLIPEPHDAALRLFNGFYEGCPELVADLYLRTLVLYNYADPPETGQGLLDSTQELLLERLPWITCVVRKTRAAASPEERCGRVVWGGPPARRVREGGVWYALNLTLNQDAGFYLDTRGLRTWLREHCSGLS